MVDELSRPHRREAVGACCMLTSPTYHLPRRRQDMPKLTCLARRIPQVADDADREHA